MRFNRVCHKTGQFAGFTETRLRSLINTIADPWDRQSHKESVKTACVEYRRSCSSNNANLGSFILSSKMSNLNILVLEFPSL